MVKAIRSKPQIQIPHRRGEGTPVEVVQQNIIGTDGKTIVSQNINLANAPVPERRYLADKVSALYEDELVKLFFGQAKVPSSNDLRTLLVIYMNPNAVRVFIQSVENLKNPSLSEIQCLTGLQPVPIYTIEKEPDQTIALAANICIVAMFGRETTIDFYNASAFALIFSQTTKKLELEPVVRIDIQTSKFISLYGKIREFRDSFPPEAIPEAIKEGVAK